MSKRFLKKTAILSIYLLIFFGIVFSIYWTHRPPAPQCLSSYVNSSGKTVGCGGTCSACPLPNLMPIKVMQSGFIETSAGNYDTYVQIQNNNSNYGASSINYSLDFLDSQGKTLASISGTTFILPDSIRFVINQGISVSGIPVSVKFNIDHIYWTQLNNFSNPQITVNRKEFEKPQAGYAEFFGSGIINQSIYAFNSVEIDVVVEDSSGKIIGVGKTEIYTLGSQETRYFTLGWPAAFKGSPQTVNVYPEVNILDESSILQNYGSPQTIQQF